MKVKELVEILLSKDQESEVIIVIDGDCGMQETIVDGVDERTCNGESQSVIY